MKLWKRAYGALKDKNSILIVNLSIKKTQLNTQFEVAIIKATSHDESKLDYKNTKRIFAWLHASPAYLKLLLCALSVRLQKTRSWVVAVKGLMLVHGVLRCSNIPTVQKIGRLSFDMSNFKDSCRETGRFGGLNDFVQSYFAFLDERSAFLYMDHNKDRKGAESALMQQLVKLQQLQSLLDILLQIKPRLKAIDLGLVYEVMDCLIIEIFSFYNRICNGVSTVLSGVYAADKVEAAMALAVLQKASRQSEQLVLYLNFCRRNGVFNASQFPKIEQIPEKDILKLEQIVNGGDSENQAMVLERFEPKEKQEEEEPKWVFKTIITDKWEVFDEAQDSNGHGFPDFLGKQAVVQNPSPALLNHLPSNKQTQKYELPDLITF